MKLAAITALLALFAIADAHADVIFSSYLRSDAGMRFVLTETESGKTSGWIAEGVSFNGFTITGFDSKQELLSVRNGDRVLSLPLKPGAVKPGAPEKKNIPAPLVFQLTKEGNLADPAGAKQKLIELKATHDQVEIELQQPKDGTEFMNAMRFIYAAEQEVGIKVTELHAVKAKP